MNNVLNEYIESLKAIIDVRIKTEVKEETKNKKFVAFAIIILALIMNNFNTGVGYLTYAVGIIMRGIKEYKKHIDNEKSYEEEKKYLSKLKSKENKLSEEEKEEKTNKKDKLQSLVKYKEANLKYIGYGNDLLFDLVIFGSLATMGNIKYLWLPIAGLSVYAITSIVESKYNKKLGKDRSKMNNLNHDICIDRMISDYSKEKVKVLEKKEEKEVTNAITKNVEKAEEIVEALANQKDIEEDKPKQIIKK